MKFNIDYNKLVVLLLPTFLRKEKYIAYLRSAIAPVIKFHYSFLKLKEDDHYKLDHNWQVCYLETVLNDRFDTSERRIKIVEGDQYLRQYIYTSGEKLAPKYLGTLYIRPSSDFADKGFDFIIDMNGVSSDVYDIRAQVNFYKLEGTRFNIINLG